MKKKRRTYSAEELTNDPSLKYFDYRMMEALLSDEHGDVRFAGYEKENIKIADLQTMAVLPLTVNPLKIRRRRDYA